MNDSEESRRRVAHANCATDLLTHKNGPGSESCHAGARQSSNWAWSTSHDQYDWMDSHTLSGELGQL